MNNDANVKSSRFSFKKSIFYRKPKNNIENDFSSLKTENLSNSYGKCLSVQSETLAYNLSPLSANSSLTRPDYKSDSLKSFSKIKSFSTISRDTVHRGIVRFLDERFTPINFSFTKSNSGSDIFHQICDEMGLDSNERFLFGLRFMDEKYEQIYWLDLSKNFSFQMRHSFEKVLYFEIKYFVDKPEVVLPGTKSRDLFYYQVKKEIMNNNFHFARAHSKNWLIALMMQDEVVSGEKLKSAFTFAHQLLTLFPEPERHSNLDRQEIFKNFEEIRDLNKNEARAEFLRIASQVSDYGSRFLTIRDASHNAFLVSIQHRGFCLFEGEGLEPVQIYEWSTIHKFTGVQKMFFMHLKSQETSKKKGITVKYRCADRAANQALLQIAFDSLCFYTLDPDVEKQRKRNQTSTTLSRGIIRGKDQFVYAGKSHKEVARTNSCVLILTGPEKKTSFRDQTISSAPTVDSANTEKNEEIPNSKLEAEDAYSYIPQPPIPTDEEDEEEKEKMENKEIVKSVETVDTNDQSEKLMQLSGNFEDHQLTLEPIKYNEDTISTEISVVHEDIESEEKPSLGSEESFIIHEKRFQTEENPSAERKDLLVQLNSTSIDLIGSEEDEEPTVVPLQSSARQSADLHEENLDHLQTSTTKSVIPADQPSPLPADPIIEAPEFPQLPEDTDEEMIELCQAQDPEVIAQSVNLFILSAVLVLLVALFSIYLSLKSSPKTSSG